MRPGLVRRPDRGCHATPRGGGGRRRAEDKGAPQKPPGPGGGSGGRRPLRQPAARRRRVTSLGWLREVIFTGWSLCPDPAGLVSRTRPPACGQEKQCGKRRDHCDPAGRSIETGPAGNGPNDMVISYGSLVARRSSPPTGPPPSETPGRVPFPDTYGSAGRSRGSFLATPGGSPATPPAAPPFWFSGFLKTPQTHARSGPGVARQKTVFEATSTPPPLRPRPLSRESRRSWGVRRQSPPRSHERGPRPGVQPAVPVHRTAADVPHIPVPMIIMHVHMHRAYSPGGSRCH